METLKISLGSIEFERFMMASLGGTVVPRPNHFQHPRTEENTADLRQLAARQANPG